MCDDVPDTGGTFIVPTPKSIITCYIRRRGKKGEILIYDGEIIRGRNGAPIICLGSWKAPNEGYLTSVIGSALHLRGVNVDFYHRECDMCNSSHPECIHDFYDINCDLCNSFIPNCKHPQRSHRFADGHAKYSHQFIHYMDQVIEMNIDRKSLATRPISPFQLLKYSRSAWYSGDFLGYIY